MTPLAIYLSSVLATIIPSMHADRRESIADDVATVTLSEPRAFDGDDDGQQTGLLLLAIAHLETGRSWATWIDNGKCNDDAWRKAHPQWLKGGDCDGGHAWSMWQVHPPQEDTDAGRAIGRSYVADRKTGIRAALAIASASLKSGAGLCHYSGETYPKCRLASLRLTTARNWIAKFPWHREEEHVATGAPEGDHAFTGVE